MDEWPDEPGINTPWYKDDLFMGILAGSIVAGRVISYYKGVETADDLLKNGANPLDDYPTNPDNWRPPSGWKENVKAKEGSGGKHRHFEGPDGKWRSWDREGRQSGKERGPHWHDSERGGGKEHIDPTR
jgi:hypothetical protein